MVRRVEGAKIEGVRHPELVKGWANASDEKAEGTRANPNLQVGAVGRY